MKNRGLFCLLLASMAFVSCKNNRSDKIMELKEAEEPINVQCYKAIYEQDTLDLKINTFKNGDVTGNMDMVVAKTPKRVGEIAGKFSGDTLYASYTFIQGGNKEVTFKNPMAFLKRNNQLVLGNGQIEVTLGASHFVKGEPIEFDRVKYKFDAIDCATK